MSRWFGSKGGRISDEEYDSDEAPPAPDYHEWHRTPARDHPAAVKRHFRRAHAESKRVYGDDATMENLAGQDDVFRDAFPAPYYVPSARDIHSVFRTVRLPVIFSTTPSDAADRLKMIPRSVGKPQDGNTLEHSVTKQQLLQALGVVEDASAPANVGIMAWGVRSYCSQLPGVASLGISSGGKAFGDRAILVTGAGTKDTVANPSQAAGFIAMPTSGSCVMVPEGHLVHSTKKDFSAEFMESVGMPQVTLDLFAEKFFSRNLQSYVVPTFDPASRDARPMNEEDYQRAVVAHHMLANTQLAAGIASENAPMAGPAVQWHRDTSADPPRQAAITWSKALWTAVAAARADKVVDTLVGGSLEFTLRGLHMVPNGGIVSQEGVAAAFEVVLFVFVSQPRNYQS